MKLRVIQDVVDRQLCTGCGACAAVEPERFRMADAPDFGRRPFLHGQPAPESGDGMAVCPGVSLQHEFDPSDPGLINELIPGWGPVRQVYEGFAAEPEIRRRGSSGGAATALALYAIERGGCSGALHTAAAGGLAYQNETVLSTSRDELLERTGSRYAPASPCDGLPTLLDLDHPAVFIGKPCDVAAVAKARALRPEIDAKIGLTVAFFCAGVPSTRGNLELLRRMKCEDPAMLRSLRYRGDGWPGMWRAEWTDALGEQHSAELSYAESWGFLQRYRQWRCYICPDHTGEFADIAVGDPWYRPIEPGEPGKSLIIPRTERGVAMLADAVEAGYIVLETQDSTLLPRSQPNLLATRGGLWGRLLALRFFGVPVPVFRGFPTWRFWLGNLSPKQKIQSVVGTAKRVFRKGLRHPARVQESSPGSGDGGGS